MVREEIDDNWQPRRRSAPSQGVPHEHDGKAGSMAGGEAEESHMACGAHHHLLPDMWDSAPCYAKPPSKTAMGQKK